MHSVSGGQLWAGRIMSGIAVVFLLFDGLTKVTKLGFVVDATVQLGYPESSIFPIGVLVLAGLALYLAPPTSLLGAIYLTGFLGGAVATHVRVGNPLFTHVLFPTYLAMLLWGGLALRDARLRALLTNEE